VNLLDSVNELAEAGYSEREAGAMRDESAQASTKNAVSGYLLTIDMRQFPSLPTSQAGRGEHDATTRSCRYIASTND
jgi:hypothetical protein